MITDRGGTGKAGKYFVTRKRKQNQKIDFIDRVFNYRFEPVSLGTWGGGVGGRSRRTSADWVDATAER